MKSIAPNSHITSKLLDVDKNKYVRQNKNFQLLAQRANTQIQRNNLTYYNSDNHIQSIQILQKKGVQLSHQKSSTNNEQTFIPLKQQQFKPYSNLNKSNSHSQFDLYKPRSSQQKQNDILYGNFSAKRGTASNEYGSRNNLEQSNQQISFYSQEFNRSRSEISKKDMIFNNQKQGSYINDKIVDLDNEVNQKMNILDRLIGNYREGPEFRDKFLRMLIVNKKDSAQLVQGRAIGKIRRTSGMDFDENSVVSTSSLPRLTSSRDQSPCPSVILNLASNGKAYSNNKPLEAVKKIIMHHKPNIHEACLPDQVHHQNVRWCPKHAKKLIQIEDIMWKKQQVLQKSIELKKEESLIKIFQQDQSLQVQDGDEDEESYLQNSPEKSNKVTDITDRTNSTFKKKNTDQKEESVRFGEQSLVKQSITQKSTTQKNTTDKNTLTKLSITHTPRHLAFKYTDNNPTQSDDVRINFKSKFDQSIYIHHDDQDIAEPQSSNSNQVSVPMSNRMNSIFKIKNIDLLEQNKASIYQEYGSKITEESKRYAVSSRRSSSKIEKKSGKEHISLIDSNLQVNHSITNLQQYLVGNSLNIQAKSFSKLIPLSPEKPPETIPKIVYHPDVEIIEEIPQPQKQEFLPMNPIFHHSLLKNKIPPRDFQGIIQKVQRFDQTESQLRNQRLNNLKPIKKFIHKKAEIVEQNEEQNGEPCQEQPEQLNINKFTIVKLQHDPSNSKTEDSSLTNTQKLGPKHTSQTNSKYLVTQHAFGGMTDMNSTFINIVEKVQVPQAKKLPAYLQGTEYLDDDHMNIQDDEPQEPKGYVVGNNLSLKVQKKSTSQRWVSKKQMRPQNSNKKFEKFDLININNKDIDFEAIQPYQNYQEFEVQENKQTQNHDSKTQNHGGYVQKIKNVKNMKQSLSKKQPEVFGLMINKVQKPSINSPREQFMEPIPVDTQVQNSQMRTNSQVQTNSS